MRLRVHLVEWSVLPVRRKCRLECNRPNPGQRAFNFARRTRATTNPAYPICRDTSAISSSMATTWNEAPVHQSSRPYPAESSARPRANPPSRTMKPHAKPAAVNNRPASILGNPCDVSRRRYGPGVFRPATIGPSFRSRDKYYLQDAQTNQ